MEQVEIMPVRVKIAAILRKAILAGEFYEGQELSLTDLGKKLGVSRTPVREALQTLASEGLIQLRMNRGAIVKGITPKFITDHYEMRILLECEAVARATVNQMDTSDLLAIQQKIEDNLSVVTQNEYVNYNQFLHTSIWKAADNQKLYNFLMGLWNGPSVGKTTTDADHRFHSIQEHGEIIQYIHSCEPDKAKKVMDKHIRRSMKNILDSYNLKS